VVPTLADSYVAGEATIRAAFAAAWTAPHKFGGALLGDHLGQLLAIGWSVTVSLLIPRTGMLARWAGWAVLLAGGAATVFVHLVVALVLGDTGALGAPDPPRRVHDELVPDEGMHDQ
jgi:hypothetical protein